MARLTPTVHRASQGGTLFALTGPNVDGDAIPPGAAVLVTNANAAPVTITIDTPGTVGGLAIDQSTVVVANGTSRLIGPWPEAHFRQTSGVTEGLVHLNYSIQASITRAAIAVTT